MTDNDANEPKITLSLLDAIDAEIGNIGKKTQPMLTRANASLEFLADNLTKHGVDAAHTQFKQYEIYSEKMIRALAHDELAASLFSEIDINQIYCNITGRPLGARDKDAVGMSIEIHGLAKMRDYAWLFIQTSQAEHWMDTSPQALIKLQKLDPIGFFVFCANLLIQRKAPGDYRQQHKSKQANFEGVWVAQKVSLYGALQQKPIEEILEATNIMISILGFLSPAKLRETKGLLPYSSLVAFVHENNWRNMRQNLKNACAEVIKRYNPRIRSYTPEQLQQMQTQIGGVGFFRSMRLKDYENDYEYAAALAAAYGGFTVANLSLANWRMQAEQAKLNLKKERTAFKSSSQTKVVETIGFECKAPQQMPVRKTPLLPIIPKLNK